MSHKPTRKHSTSNLPNAKLGDIAFHTDTLKPMFWNNGWHQFDNEYRGPVDLFIIAGQSNAHGHALVSGLNDDQIITNDVMFHTSWHQNTSNATTTQYYTDWAFDVTAGSTRGSGTSTTLVDKTQFGPELGFARRAKQLSSTRAKIGIVKHAIGASTLSEGETRDIVVHNGVLYRCIQSHQDTDSGSSDYHLPAVTEPGVGSDWQTYWIVDTNNVHDTDSAAVIGNYIVFLKDKYFGGDQQTIAAGTPAKISNVSETVVQIPNTHSGGVRNLTFSNLGDVFGYSPAFDWTSGRDYNGTDLSDWDTGDFPDDVRSGDALRAWKRTVDDAVSKLTQLNITYRWRGLIWWQGESGTNTTVVQELMNHMRNYIDEPELPTILTRIGYGTGNTWTSPDVFSNMTNVGLVDATEFGHAADRNHVGYDNGADARDMFNIGMEYANKFAELFGETPITKIDQTILFPGQPSKDQSAGTHTISNVSTSSGLPVTFTSSDTSVATIEGNVVTMLTPGTITITATQAGDSTHNPATATQTFLITDGLWTPEYDSGVVGWWDASDTSTLTIQSGTGKVTQWSDKTDNDADFVPWSGEATQSTETVGDTTLDTIHMDNDALTTATLTNTQAETLGLTTDTTKQKDLIWYFVARADASASQDITSGNEALFQFSGTTSTQAGTRQFILLNTNNSTTNNLYWYNLAGGVTTTANTANSTYPAATSPDFFMIGTRINTTGGTISTWQGGGAVVVDKANPADPPDTNTSLRLNRYQKTLEGEWGEIVVSSSTDEVSRKKMEGYLAHKWGIALPSGHTYESEAP